MQVFTLIGSWDYEGDQLVGVFGSVESVQRCVQSKTWTYDAMYFMVSEIGEPVDNRTSYYPVSFTRYNGETVEV